MHKEIMHSPRYMYIQYMKQARHYSQSVFINKRVAANRPSVMKRIYTYIYIHPYIDIYHRYILRLYYEHLTLFLARINSMSSSTAQTANY